MHSSASDLGPLRPVSYSELMATLRSSFAAGFTRDHGWRHSQLHRLETLLGENQSVLVDALRADLGKCASEAWLSDLGLTVSSIRFARKNLRKWIGPRSVRTPITLFPAHSQIIREPVGVVLVIGAWNYPVQLALMPLVAAVAAGNCVVVKPSEISAATSAALARLIPQYLDTNSIAVVTGGAQETAALLKQNFDHIFYTGGASVGRLVMQAAAQHLTPVTLELGGKSPCIVDETANVEIAARRIAFGKFLNAGQTCIAPDYVLVLEARREELLAALKRAIVEFYGENPRSSPDYARIVNDRHFDRVCRLLAGNQIVVGGETDRESRFIAPTILRQVDPGSPIMTEEVFGPVLPVLDVSTLTEAIDFVNARPKPLALYLFTASSRSERTVLRRTISGGVCINATLLHHANERLPFGGVGDSGFGYYHGRFGFETFTHPRAVVRKPARPDIRLGYPPYTKLKDFLLRWIL